MLTGPEEGQVEEGEGKGVVAESVEEMEEGIVQTHRVVARCDVACLAVT